MDRFADDFTSLSDELLQWIIVTRNGSPDAERADEVLEERKKNSLLRRCRWRVETRGDAVFVALIVATSKEEAGDIFLNELQVQKLGQASEQGGFLLSDPRVESLRIQHNLRKEELIITYEGEVSLGF